MSVVAFGREILSFIENLTDVYAKGAAGKREFRLRLLELSEKAVSESARAQSKAINLEAQGGVLQRNWRPLFMLVIIAIIAGNYLIFPLLSAFFGTRLMILPLPSELWSLLTVGVGGYVIGRSGEKIVSARLSAALEEARLQSRVSETKSKEAYAAPFRG